MAHHAPAEIPQPEVAAGKAGAAVNLSSSAGSADKPHAKLVIERGKSVGKQFLLSSAESHIGRWDADGGIFPDVDLDSDDPEAKVSRRHARITFATVSIFWKIWVPPTALLLIAANGCRPGRASRLSDGDEIIVGKTFLRFHG